MYRSPFEVTLLIEDHPCEVMKIISLAGLKASVENVKLGEQTTDHIVSFEKEIGKNEVLKLKSNSVKVLKLSETKVWVRTNGCAVCRILYTSDIVVEKIKVLKERTLLYTLLVLASSSFNEFLTKLSKEGVKVTVLNVSEISSAELTKRQMEILQLAYKLGYFNDERGITLSQLADKLGISAPTLEEILRRALRKVVKYYLDKH
ncbi:Bacterio-opsin activator HTH domain protein [Acidianus hospitalis W1]|uniref:Bacterio-opsin activator HTH domain protein n=1 Tax=Acidianus hospitalis (strain W1) TaxID=933801 RepID=F4B6C5_ACIHW|nr:helix-turn-helix domain-containing protein [Acidianus hospitalis]AEE94545.1 Bacterio-opsin activator HTH domain protein [Acidianus hospitalis W1]